MEICITGTGFRGEARREIRRLAEVLGLEYSGVLVRNRTTHLVLASDTLALSAEDLKSQKMKSAQSWGVPVTRYAWIEDSLKKGKVLDANKYLLQGHSSPCSSSSTLFSGDWTPEQLRSDQIFPAQHSAPLWSSGQPSTDSGSNAGDSSRHHSSMHLAGSPRHTEAHSLGVSKPRSPTASCSVSSELLLCDPGSSYLQRSSAFTVHDDGQSTPCSKLCTSKRKQKSSRMGDYLEHTLAHQAGCTATSPPCAETCSMSEGNDQLSPESVQVRAEEPRRSCPKGSTAAAFHGVSQGALTYYEKLTVIHHNSNSSLSLHFDLRQRSHCALVYYEDANSDEHELAYADLLYSYSLPGGDVYIEHGYLFDTEDLQQHPMGRVFLKSCQLQDYELVDSPGIYHSLATVIEGEFWLTSRKRAQVSEHSTRHKDETPLTFFCNKAWDRETGQQICVSRHKVKSAKQFVRG